MEARIHYRKLMLLHNIINSDEKRLIRRILLAQKKWNRSGTWYNEVTKILEMYNIPDEVEGTLKSSWKKKVKESIWKITEEKLKKKCEKIKKAITIKEDAYERKTYLNE